MKIIQLMKPNWVIEETSRKKYKLRNHLEDGDPKRRRKYEEFWVPVNSCEEVFCGPGSTGGHHLITPFFLKEVKYFWGRASRVWLRHPGYGEASSKHKVHK